MNQLLPQDLLLRVAEEKDLSACAEIYVLCFNAPPYNEPWDREEAQLLLSILLQRDPGFCFVAEYQGRVIAFSFCSTLGPFRATIEEFAVHPRFQKRGVGSTLLEHTLDALKEAGYFVVYLVAHREAKAYCFYQKHGFRETPHNVLMVRLL